MSRSSSLLAGGADVVSLHSAWSSLPAGCSNSMILSFFQTSSLSAALGCSFEMLCGAADSAGCPVVVMSEALSVFAAQGLRIMDREAVRILMVIGLAPLF